MGMCGCGRETHLTTLVDKLIGTPYEVVKYVAQHMGAVQEVADHLGMGGACPGMLTKRSCKVTGTIGALGSTSNYALPDAVDPTKVINVQANVTTADGSRYFNDSRYFYVSIQSGKLSFTLRPDAPAGFANSKVEWFIIFEV